MQQNKNLDPITLPLFDSRLIEASAGTGKTHTIAILYLRLVLGLRGDQRGGEPLTPPQILVTTFTQAAVEELRDRIRARLSEMSAIFADNHPPTAKPLAQLFAQYPDQAERDHAAFLLQRAAEWMDEAAIYTIHGFCQRMLSEHAFHSRALFEQTLITDLEPIKEQAVRDFWRSHGYALSERLADAEIFADTFESPSRFYAHIKDFLQRDGRHVALADKTYNNSQSLPPMAELIAKLNNLRQTEKKAQSQAKAALQRDFEVLKANWLDAKAGLNKQSHPEAKSEADLLGWFAELYAWATDPSVDIADKKLEKLIAPKTNKNAELPVAVPAIAAINDWQLLRKQNQAEQHQQQKKMQAYGLLWVRERISSELELQQQMSFDDLLTQMDQALAPTNPAAFAMCNAIRRQYPVAMIDEFQDTDPQQLRIFDAIYDIERHQSANDSTIILIGDPKQAIYGFRGADIYSYLAARHKTEGRHTTLGVNYRSTAAAVNAVNKMFLQAEQAKPGVFSIDTDDTAQTLSFEAVDANGKPDRLIDASGVLPAANLWQLPVTEPASTTLFRQCMAEVCAEDIARKLAASQRGELGFAFADEHGIQKPLQASDIAILVRSYTEAELIRAELGLRAVPCVFLSERTSVFQSEQARDLSRWLAAMHQPERADLIRLALSTRSGGLSRAQLVRYLEHEPAFDDVSLLFQQLKQTWSEQGVLASILKLVHFFELGGLHPATTQRNAARVLTNIMHLADWLNQQSEQIEGQAALIQRLEQACEHDPKEQELRLEQDADLVRIITIHKSKGLQFPVVYLPFIAALGLSAGNKKEMLVQTEGGQKKIQFLPQDADIQQQRAEEQAEDMRLLYVGLTRAEYAMYLGLGPVIAGRKKSWNMQDGPTGRLLGLDPDPKKAANSFEQAMNQLSQHDEFKVIKLDYDADDRTRIDTQSVIFTPTVRTPEPRDFKPWWISSFSALATHYHQQLTAPEDARAEREAEPGLSSQKTSITTTPLAAQHQAVLAMPKGAQIGTLLHDLIERVLLLQKESRNPHGLEEWQTWITQTRHPHKPPEIELQNTLAKWLYDLFSLHIKTPYGATLSLRELSLLQTEMEFWFACHATQTQQIDAVLRQYLHPSMPRPPLANHHLNGMIKGFIDLVFEFEGRYYLIDWKSNYLGAQSEHYQPAQLTRAVLEARYDLQYSLYALALHRHLADRIDNYEYNQHFGGVMYVFLRGIYVEPQAGQNHASPGVYLQRPPQALLDDLDACFSEQECVA